MISEVWGQLGRKYREIILHREKRQGQRPSGLLSAHRWLGHERPNELSNEWRKDANLRGLF